MKENMMRSVVKSVSWRVLGTIDTVFIAWLVTGKTDFALTIGGIEVFTKMILFFIHERLWTRVRFGQSKSELILNQ